MNARTFTNRFASPLIDFLYPPVCISCTTPLPDGSQKVCTACWNAIPHVTQLLPLYQETRERLLAEGGISDLISCFVFEKNGPFQHIAHALKYQEYKSLGRELGTRIGKVLGDGNVDIDILIPLPLHRIKLRERGYNQSEFIARGIASVIGKPVVLNTVRRTRHTQTQTKLNIEERRKNMEHAFELIPQTANILQEKKCLLVDDVITTGATMNSCAQVLLSSGVSSIIAASAALAQ